MTVICARRGRKVASPRPATFRTLAAYKATMGTAIEGHLAAGRHARAFDLIVPEYSDRVFRLA